MKDEILKTINEFKRFEIDNQIDYEKYYLYSIITHSTAIEGSTVTELENRLLFDDGISASKPIAEQLMNLDLRNAYLKSRSIVNKHEDFSERMLCYLSSVVMKNTGSEYRTISGDFSSSNGDLRLINVSAGRGGKSYLAWEKIPSRLKEFCDFVNSSRKKIDKSNIYGIYKLSFEAHYRLVQIHPWADGNGRMSRLVMNMIQTEYDVIPSYIEKSDKPSYIESLVASEDSGDSSYFIEFMFNEHIKLLKKQISEYKKSLDN